MQSVEVDARLPAPSSAWSVASARTPTDAHGSEGRLVNRLELEVDRPNGHPVVVAKLVGELDLSTVADAGPEVLAAAGNDSLVLDLTG